MKYNLQIREQLHNTALKAPKSSGVYLWRNEEGIVIYVGKAKNLKNRLTSYFSGQKDFKTMTLISKAHSIEYITTANEYEALILENNLIKQYHPKYNICLKDDKTYPLLKITNEPYPRIYKTRRMIKDGSAYFGPYPNVAALDLFIETIHHQYKIRHCKKMTNRSAPCMYYHINRCSAPCCNKISKDNYNAIIGEITHLLEKAPKETVNNLEKEMKEAAMNLDFERAAKLRDNIMSLKILSEQNSVMDFDGEARDYIGFASEGPLLSFAVLKMRFGKLLACDIYQTETFKDEDEILPEFFLAYYTDKEKVPCHIFVGIDCDTPEIKQWFSENLDVNPKIHTISDKMENVKRQKALFNMALQNAKEDIVKRVRANGDFPAMEELKDVLALPSLPVRIEGFDIAHIGGKLPVASLISFYNGQPDKKNYRYFRLKTTDGIIDDFASMREACARRYTRLLNENLELPDLIMIDGGIGQVNAVKEILDALNLDIPVVGLAKRDEELYLPGNSIPIRLPRRSRGLQLLQRVRDETHRFATSHNQQLRTKSYTTTRFEKIPNIGKARAKILIDRFGSFEKLCVAEPEEIYTVLKCSMDAAIQIKKDAILIKENNFDAIDEDSKSSIDDIVDQLF